MSAYRRNEPDLYGILGLDRDADPEDIEKAFSIKTRKMHPTRGGDPEDFEELNRAYSVLKDPIKRQYYDDLGWDALVDAERTGTLGMIGEAQVPKNRKPLSGAEFATPSSRSGTVVDDSLYNSCFSEQEVEGLWGGQPSRTRVKVSSVRSKKKRTKKQIPKEESSSSSEEEEEPVRPLIQEPEDIQVPQVSEEHFLCTLTVQELGPTGKKLGEPCPVAVTEQVSGKTEQLRKQGRAFVMQPPPSARVLVKCSALEMFSRSDSSGQARKFEVKMTSNCPKCKGSGTTETQEGPVLTKEQQKKGGTCPLCSGQKTLFGNPCPSCQGTGCNLVKAGYKPGKSKVRTGSCSSCSGSGTKTETNLIQDIRVPPDAQTGHLIGFKEGLGATSYGSFPARGLLEFVAEVLPIPSPYLRDLNNGLALWMVVEIFANWTEPGTLIRIGLPGPEGFGSGIYVQSKTDAIRHLDVAKISGLGFGGKGVLYLVFNVSSKDSPETQRATDPGAPSSRLLEHLKVQECKAFGSVQTLGAPSSTYVYPYVRALHGQ